MPGRANLPGTIKRSDKHAQQLFGKVLANAEKEYGDGERAHRTAIAALKNEYEKVGDHWQRKGHKGASDPRSAESSREKRHNKGETFGGVDLYGHTKEQLYQRARKLDVAGRSRMSKEELARAIAKKQ